MAHDRTRHLILRVAALALSLAPAEPALADGRFLFGANAGVGSLHSEDQLGHLQYLGFGGGLRANVTYGVLGPLGVDAQASMLGFVSEQPTGSLIELGLGVRVWARMWSTPLYVGPSIHANLAQTGADTRPSADAGLRLGWMLNEQWTLGPELTLTRVFQTSGGRNPSTDAEFWLASLAIVYTPPNDPPPAPPRQVLKPLRLSRRRPQVDHPPAPPSPRLNALLDQVVTKRHETRLFPPVLFEFDSTDLIACGEAALHNARDYIGRTNKPVVIEGHADSAGEDAYNDTLSRRRAQFVLRWLVAHGVPPDQLTVGSLGEQRLLVQETDDDQSQLNRRVTFRILDAGGAP